MSDIEQQRKEAQDETTPPKQLQELSVSPDSLTRQYVAQNPNTPTQTLLNSSDEFPQQVLNNDVIPLLLIETPQLFSCPFRFDLVHVIRVTSRLMKCLGWTVEDGKLYLMQTYGQKSRNLLSDEQLLEFMRMLQNLKDSQQNNNTCS